MILRQLKSDALNSGYRTMRLETATFMHNAHALYRSHDFRIREPYRTIPDKFMSVTLWMECPLWRETKRAGVSTRP